MTLKKLSFIFIFLGAFLSLDISAQATADAGKTLFRNYCATCHARDMKTAGTGPALGGAEERWADYPKEDLYSWIETHRP